MYKLKVLTVVVAGAVLPLVGLGVRIAIATPFWQIAQSVERNSPAVTPVPVLNLYEKGNGEIEIFDGRDREVDRALVTVRPNRSVDVTFGLSNSSRPFRLSGGLTSWSKNTLVVQLTNSGDTGASGELTIVYGENQSIYSISGTGRISGRQMSVAFNGAVALTQSGSGLFTLKDGPSQNITKVSVTSQSKGNLDLVFFLNDGKQITFSGSLAERDDQKLRIQLFNSANTIASGTIAIEYGTGNSINSVSGDGKLDGRDFSVKFNP